MNLLHLHFILSVKYQFLPYLASFPDILNLTRQNVGFGIAKFPRLTSCRCVSNVTQTSVNKQRYWILNVSPLKWRVCGCGLNQFVHEGMNHISNVKVHLKFHSGNVNI